MFPSSPERREFKAVGTLITGISLAVFLVVLGFVLYGFQKKAELPPAALDDLPPPAHSPLWEAEFESGEIRAVIDMAAKQKLASYGWVDREKGIVRIPVARAMELLAERRRR